MTSVTEVWSFVYNISTMFTYLRNQWTCKYACNDFIIKFFTCQQQSSGEPCSSTFERPKVWQKTHVPHSVCAGLAADGMGCPALWMMWINRKAGFNVVLRACKGHLIPRLNVWCLEYQKKKRRKLLSPRVLHFFFVLDTENGKRSLDKRFPPQTGYDLAYCSPEVCAPEK